MRALWERLKTTHPIRLTFAGYLLYVVLGWIGLCLPWSVEEGLSIGALDHLFIATSAVSTTGLATVSPPATYSWLGEGIILLMIQVGGIGYMTLGSFVMLTRTRSLSKFREGISRTTFSLPEDIPLEVFLRQVIFFTVGVEICGALALWAAFSRAEVPGALWQAIFHSVSAFCTAGFSLFDSGLEPFRGDFWVNAIVCVLSYAGAIGFIVWTDLVLVTLGQRERMTLTSKIILSATFWLTLFGASAFMVLEPTLAALPTEERLMASVFQTMTAITTVGFNTHPIGAISGALLVATVALMLIGASPSGTGGGLKSTTVTIFFGLVRGALRGERAIQFKGRRIPEARVRAATSALVTYIGVCLLALFMIAAVERTLPLDALLFEVVSAAGTVGLSRGITGDLSPLGKLIITAVMFAGRLGPLVLGVAIFLRPERVDSPALADHSEEDLMT